MNKQKYVNNAFIHFYNFKEDAKFLIVKTTMILVVRLANVATTSQGIEFATKYKKVASDIRRVIAQIAILPIN